MENFFSIYSLIYIPLLFCIFISDLKTQRRVMVFWIIVLTLFRGLRWDCGTDWYWYEKSFNDIDITNFWRYITVEEGNDIKILEVGWGFLLMICKYTFGTYTSFLLLTNFIQLVFLYLISNMFTKRPIVVFIGFILSANFFPVRQDLACMIYFYGFCWMLTKWKYSYFAFNGLAGLVHNSAWVMMPLYWVWRNIKVNYGWAITLLIGSYILAEYFVPVIVPIAVKIVGMIAPQVAAVANNYFKYGEVELKHLSNPIYAFILNLMFCTLFYKYIIKKKNLILFDKSSSSKAYAQKVTSALVNAFIFGVVILQLFLRTVPSLSRVASYVTLAPTILFAIMFDNIRNKQTRIMAITLYMLYLLYRFYRHFDFYPELHFPYRSIFGVL